MAEHDNWDTHWDRYAEAASRNPAQQMRHALVLGLLRAKLNPKTAHLLDIGSGQGDLMVQAHGLVPPARMLGFELSESGVQISRQKVPGATFVVADLFHPPSELAGYRTWATDAVCSEVLEHVDSPELLLRASREYLADNARLIVTVPGGPISAFDRHIGHRQHFTRQSITKVLEAAGFTVDKIYLAGFPFFNLYRMIVIARGEKLATDVETGQGGVSSRFAALVMAVFRGLFALNIHRLPLGWQVVAVARKKG